MVGTPEYQLTLYSLTIRQNPRGSNFFGATSVPPVNSVANVEATSPCTWKTGITHRETSSIESTYVCAIFCAETSKLTWRNGTRFGRPVLPLVCRISAISFGCG